MSAFQTEICLLLPKAWQVFAQNLAPHLWILLKKKKYIRNTRNAQSDLLDFLLDISYHDANDLLVRSNPSHLPKSTANYQVGFLTSVTKLSQRGAQYHQTICCISQINVSFELLLVISPRLQPHSSAAPNTPLNCLPKFAALF